MKLNNFLKIKKTNKVNNEFDPTHHWYTILSFTSILFILVIFYSFYNFLYIKNQISLIEIESKNNIQNSTSTEALEKNRDKNKLLKDINNINKKIAEYEKKENEYNTIINNSIKTSFTPLNTASSTASSTVATSTE